MAKWFFYNHPAPVMVVLFHQPHLRQMLDNRAEKIGRCSQIEENITVRGVILIDLLEKIFQLGINLLVTEIAGYVIQTFAKPFHDVLVSLRPRVVVNISGDLLTKLLCRHSAMRYAHDRELARKQVSFGQVVKRGNKFAAGQIAARAKNDHHARISRPGGAPGLRDCQCFCLSHDFVSSSSSTKRYESMPSFSGQRRLLCVHRISGAWQRESSPQMCAPGGNGNG